MGAPSSAKSLPAATRIGRVALRVTDREEQTAFYRQVVGLDVLSEGDRQATLGVDGTAVLVLVEDESAPTRHRTETGLYHNAFRVPSRGALGDALTRVRSHWQLGGATDHRVSEALYLTDPEGNGVEIYHDFPREEWPETDDGRVAMGNDRLDLDSLAADAAGESSATPGTDLGHVHLEVSSLDAFRAWYVETVGFEVRATVPRATFVAAGGYHHHIGANTWHHRTAPAQSRGLSWFEVVVPTAAALDGIRERLSGRDMPVRGTDRGFAASDPNDIEVRFRTEP